MKSLRPDVPVAESTSFWQSPLSAREAIVGGLLTFLVTFCIVRVGYFGPSFTDVSDTSQYEQIALGDHTVGQPFASRQLGPLMVRGMMTLFHWPVERAFLVQATFCLMVMLAVVFLLLFHARAPRWMVPVLGLVPFVGEIYVAAALPDPFYAALLGVFLLLLWKERYLLAAAMMFPLTVARESTLLTLVCLLIVCWGALRWSGRLLALLSFVAGTVVVRHLTAHSAGNAEKMSPLLYLLAKVPFNFLRAIGIKPWASALPLCEVPAWKYAPPFAKYLGANSAIGICGFSAKNLLQWPVAAAVTFGLLPLVTAMLWWKSRRVKTDSAMMRFCLLYGGLCFLIAPVLGVWYYRLFGYGWPLFLVALPMLFHRFDSSLRMIPLRSGVALLVIEAALCVLPRINSEVLSLIAVPLLYVGAVLLLVPIVRQAKLVTAA